MRVAAIFSWIWENTGVKERAIGFTLAGIMIAGAVVWSIMDGVPHSIIGWFAMATAPIFAFSLPLGVEAYRRTFGKQAELRIESQSSN